MDLDDYYVNAAYLSELWAVNDIKEKMEIFDLPFLKLQYEDEKRHADILLEVLKSETTDIIYDLDFAMQNRIYKKELNHDLSDTRDNLERFLGYHQVTERRALRIYRSYIKGGHKEKYKNVMKSIMLDEKNHLHDKDYKDELVLQVYNDERNFFLRNITSKYGINLIDPNCKFWPDYFNNKFI